jgi:hypothetical protein
MQRCDKIFELNKGTEVVLTFPDRNVIGVFIGFQDNFLVLSKPLEVMVDNIGIEYYSRVNRELGYFNNYLGVFSASEKESWEYYKNRGDNSSGRKR